ncbi:DUF6630 family protein [Actinocrispum sp. NPDC049592]|uniref:DUF6630 family protein n=1 Tax=Actinocrispum sp. NPDC049592 TaxID=3154835 RepID=UPI0034295BC8
MPLPARDALNAIATLLAPDAPEVAALVDHAHTDPSGYLQAHADRLDERGIDEAEPELAWIALVNALTDHGLLAEVDWKEDPGDIVGQLRELRSSPGPSAWVWFDDTDLPTYDFLEFAGARLREAGTALAVLDIESDCYPLVLLAASRADELVSLAADAGFTAAVLGGHPSAG